MEGSKFEPAGLREKRIAADGLLEWRKRAEEAEAQVAEDAQLIERLTLESFSKSEQIKQMEIAIAKEIEKQEETLSLLQEEASTHQSTSTHEISMLKRRIVELELGLESYNVLEATNTSLRTRVDSLMNDLEAAEKSYQEEITKMRKENFNHKMTLESTFRKTLQTMDRDYLANAFEAMNAESKSALTANAKLKEELYIQSNGVENLMSRFQSQAEAFHKLKVKNEILEKGSEARLKEIATLKRRSHGTLLQLQESRKSNIHLEATKNVNDERKIQELESKLSHTLVLLDKAQNRSEKWKTRALSTTTKESKTPKVARRIIPEIAPIDPSLLWKSSKQREK